MDGPQLCMPRDKWQNKRITFQQRKPTTNAREFIFQTDPILPDKSEPPNISAMDYKLVTSLLAFCQRLVFSVILARLDGIHSFSSPYPTPTLLLFLPPLLFPAAFSAHSTSVLSLPRSEQAMLEPPGNLRALPIKNLVLVGGPSFGSSDSVDKETQCITGEINSHLINRCWGHTQGVLAAVGGRWSQGRVESEGPIWLIKLGLASHCIDNIWGVFVL